MKKKNVKSLRAVHALEVSNTILDTLENSSEDVTPFQEMTLLLLSEIMFNTAVLVDLNNSKERGTHDDKRYKCNDC